MADFYLRTAASLDKILANTQSVKAAAAPHHDSKRVLALLVNTLAYRHPLTQVLEHVNVAKLERRSFPDRSLTPSNPPAAIAPTSKRGKPPLRGQANGTQKPHKTSSASAPASKGNGSAPSSASTPTTTSLLLVLAHDLLFSNRGIQAAKAWPPKLAIERHRARLHSELVKLQLRAGKSRIQDLRAGAIAGAQDGRSFDDIVRTIPRWARVNELKTTVQHVKAWLAERGWKEAGLDRGRTELVASNEYAVSSHIPSLLAFPPKSTSTILASELYRDGLLVLQDLASCMPAQILDPLQWEREVALTTAPGSEGSDVGLSHDGQRKRKRQAELGAIDATSAPGNKTSHLSALMRGHGHLTAFERSAPRYKTLTKLLGRSGALASPPARDKGKGKELALGNVTTINQDFLQTDPEHESWRSVRYMLVDPSCSGSGIVNRLDHLKGDEEAADAEEANEVAEGPDAPARPHAGEDKGVEDVSSADSPDETQERKTKKQQRLEKLAEFQLLMIRHAMRFPNLQRLVYSTCSIHAEENEHVVVRALQCAEASSHGWTLAPRAQVLPSWPVRGKVDECQGDERIADSVIRCIPGGTPFSEGQYPNTESCNGFFVACFIRREGQGVAEAEGADQEAHDGSQANEDVEVVRKRRKTELNRKKAEQKKRKEREKKLQQQQQQQQQLAAEDQPI